MKRWFDWFDLEDGLLASALVAALIVGGGACALFGDAEAPPPYSCPPGAENCFRGVTEPFGARKNDIAPDPAGTPLDAGPDGSPH